MINSISSRKFSLTLIYIFLALSIVIVAGKLFFMQVFAAAYYQQASLENNVRMVPVRAPRGMIVDRNGEIIVQNRPSYSVYLVPHDAPSLDKAAARLSHLLEMDESYLKDVISSGWKGRFQPIRLKRDVDFKTISVLEEHSLDVPGVVFQVEPTRLYPANGAGSHLYGYVGEISEAELLANPKYTTGDIIGQKGLERFYNDQLKGHDGVLYLEVSATGRIMGEYQGMAEMPPVKGATLELNIDWGLQVVAESLLAEQGQGAVVALDVRDGGVLVLASSPSFDANLFSGVVSLKDWEKIQTDPSHPLLNRAVQGTYPPGSAMKPFTAAMGLHFGRIDRDSHFDSCRGQKRFGNRSFKCWRPEGHGRLGLHQAIVQSCDIYFYQLGVACGIELWERYMPECRFGKQTGIDIPGEKSGNSPSTEFFNKRYGPGGWTKFLVINLAIGQGEVLVTPLQMASLYAALVNDGTILEPHIVRRIIDSDGAINEVAPKILGHMPLTSAQRQILVDALEGVTSEPGGTARSVQIEGVRVGGKTGTAQNPHGEDHSWFVCFAPVDKPEIAVAVVVENAGHGSSVAAPLARKVLEHYFKKQMELPL